MYRNIFFYGSITLLVAVFSTFSLFDGYLVRHIIDWPKVIESSMLFMLFAASCTALALYPRRGRLGHMLFVGSVLLVNVYGYTVVHNIFFVLNGEIFTWLVAFVKFLAVSSVVTATIEIYIELSDSLNQLKNRNTELKESAYTDGLSGLYNRKYLEEFIATKEFKSAQEQYSLIVMDIDDFKSTNDTYGHSVGDLVIESCGKAIRESIRVDSIGVRYGGEEFVILTKASAKNALEIARRVSKSFSFETKLLSSIEGHKTLSIGVAQLTSRTAFFEAFDQADKALYHAKNSGKNKAVIFNKVVVNH